MNDTDLNDADLMWLAVERRAAAAPDAEATARARAALLSHAVSTPVRPVPGPTRRRRKLVQRSLALAGVAAAAAVAVAALTGGHGGRSPIGVSPAAAAPLVRLATRVSHSAPPTGDATLIQRFHTFADGSTMTGADLYLDNGQYFYSPTAAGLPAEIAAGNDDDTSGWLRRELAAAVAALTLDPAQARAEMAHATIDPNAKPVSPAARSAAAAALAAQQARLKAAEAAASLKPEPPASPETLFNGSIWSNSLDALIAGAGRPDVRAGVLKLLATIPEVTVEPSTTDGTATLTLTAHVFPDGYFEQLVIDAETGTPIRFVGGNPGQTPSVVVTYRVSRVTAADLT